MSFKVIGVGEVLWDLLPSGAKMGGAPANFACHAHALGASGAIEAAICALAIDRGWLPPTVNLEAPDAACDLDYITGDGRDARVDRLVSNSFGFGGINAALVMGRAD